MINKILSTFIVFLFILLASNLQGRQSYTIKDAMNNGPGRYKLQNAVIKIDQMPNSVNEFLALRNKIGNTPMGGYALFVLSMIKYSTDQDLGMQFFVISLDLSNLIQTEKNGSYKGFYPHSSITYHIRRLKSTPYLGNVLIRNTVYQNGYKLPSTPWKIEFRQLTVRKETDVSLYALTTSGNSARPLTLKKNNRGIWKVANVSSVFVGVSKLPPGNVDDDI